ncbi:hydrolase, partial [Morganella morganii]
VRYPNSLPTNLLHIRAIKRIREFDDIITSRIHGFRDASDYYRRCSALPKLPAVRKPMLIIHAKDDPFMAQEVVPDLSQLPPCVEYQMTEHGGHVGFVTGSWRRPRLWLEERIPEWLAPHLTAKETE